MRVVRVDAATDPRWPALLAARGGSVFHSPPWLGVLAEAYGFRIQAHLATDTGGSPVAGMLFCHISDLVGERIVSLPFSDYCDPLLGSNEEWRLLLGAVEAFGLPVTLRCLDDCRARGDARFVVVKRARWHGLDIEPDPEASWRRLAAPTRRAIRKAEREGVRVHPLDEGALDEFVRLHVALRKRKYRLLAQPRSFFEAIRSRFAACGGWFPLVAHCRGRIVAVTIYLRWNDTLYYKFNASSPDATSVRPNDALLWEGIRLARRLGCRRLDLGASDDDQPGLIRFKRHYGAEEREICFLRYLPGARAGAAPSPASALLARLTELFTDPMVPDQISERAGAELYRFFA